jgi:hypothetical protein
MFYWMWRRVVWCECTCCARRQRNVGTIPPVYTASHFVKRLSSNDDTVLCVCNWDATFCDVEVRFSDFLNSYSPHSSCSPSGCKYQNWDQIQQLLKFCNSLALSNRSRSKAVPYLQCTFFRRMSGHLMGRYWLMKFCFLVNVVMSITGSTFFVFYSSSVLYATTS